MADTEFDLSMTARDPFAGIRPVVTTPDDVALVISGSGGGGGRSVAQATTELTELSQILEIAQPQQVDDRMIVLAPNLTDAERDNMLGEITEILGTSDAPIKPEDHPDMELAGVRFEVDPRDGHVHAEEVIWRHKTGANDPCQARGTLAKNEPVTAPAPQIEELTYEM